MAAAFESKMGTSPCTVCKVLLLQIFVLQSVTAQDCTAQEGSTMMQQCVKPHGRGDELCSGRGTCVCGVCQCNTKDFQTLRRYTGRYCECDDYSCSYVDGKLCGGNGQCRCGMCECLDGWTGKACECSTSNQRCVAANGKVCNDSGNCVCGACKCSSWSGFYGPTCEDCPTCKGMCELGYFQDCALCKAFKTGSYDDKMCEQKCRGFNVVDVLMDKEKAEKSKTKLCEFVDKSDGCMVKFSYNYVGDKGRTTVSVQTTKECPQKDPSSSATSLRHHQLNISLGLVGVWVAVLTHVFTARS